MKAVIALTLIKTIQSGWDWEISPNHVKLYSSVFDRSIRIAYPSYVLIETSGIDGGTCLQITDPDGFRDALREIEERTV